MSCTRRTDAPRAAYTVSPFRLRRCFVSIAFGRSRIPDMDRIPMTREGYEKLKADLDRMQTVEMPDVTRRIAAARELGDLSENAEYHAAREDQGILQARIDALRDKLGRAYFIDRNNLPTDSVVFGARVKVKDLDAGDEEVF